MNFENTSAFAHRLDQQDSLKHFRERFYIPHHKGRHCVYFVGNSLGLQPKTVSEYIQQELNDWAELGVEGHFNGQNPWLPYHEIFPQQLSEIIGSLPQEVVVMNQLTVNLHLLMVTFYRPTKQRYKIICEEKAFPSDQYTFESQARYHGFDPADAVIEVKPREGEYIIRTEDILSTIEENKDSVAVVLFSGINYYSGQLFDMPAIVKAAHAAGAYAGFDLAHAIGNVELRLHAWDADFATWCSYKYLNSGPGGVSGVYIHERFATDTTLPRFAGWWGHNKEDRFKMEKGFKAIPTAEGWQLSNAPILSMAAHKASLDIFEAAGINNLHAKAKQLSAYLFFVVNEAQKTKGGHIINVITPLDENERGCQLSMLMAERGREIFDELSDHGVIADWREPDVIRVAAVPLYNTFEDIFRFGDILTKAINR